MNNDLKKIEKEDCIFLALSVLPTYIYIEKFSKMNNFFSSSIIAVIYFDRLIHDSKFNLTSQLKEYIYKYIWNPNKESSRIGTTMSNLMFSFLDTWVDFRCLDIILFEG